jgi:hypothetical protein
VTLGIFSKRATATLLLVVVMALGAAAPYIPVAHALNGQVDSWGFNYGTASSFSIGTGIVTYCLGTTSVCAPVNHDAIVIFAACKSSAAFINGVTSAQSGSWVRAFVGAASGGLSMSAWWGNVTAASWAASVSMSASADCVLEYQSVANMGSFNGLNSNYSLKFSAPGVHGYGFLDGLASAINNSPNGVILQFGASISSASGFGTNGCLQGGQAGAVSPVAPETCTQPFGAANSWDGVVLTGLGWYFQGTAGVVGSNMEIGTPFNSGTVEDAMASVALGAHVTSGGGGITCPTGYHVAGGVCVLNLGGTRSGGWVNSSANIVTYYVAGAPVNSVLTNVTVHLYQVRGSVASHVDLFVAIRPNYQALPTNTNQVPVVAITAFAIFPTNTAPVLTWNPNVTIPPNTFFEFGYVVDTNSVSVKNCTVPAYYTDTRAGFAPTALVEAIQHNKPVPWITATLTAANSTTTTSTSTSSSSTVSGAGGGLNLNFAYMIVGMVVEIGIPVLLLALTKNEFGMLFGLIAATAIIAVSNVFGGFTNIVILVNVIGIVGLVMLARGRPTPANTGAL